MAALFVDIHTQCNALYKGMPFAPLTPEGACLALNYNKSLIPRTSASGRQVFRDLLILMKGPRNESGDWISLEEVWEKNCFHSYPCFPGPLPAIGRDIRQQCKVHERGNLLILTTPLINALSLQYSFLPAIEGIQQRDRP